MIKASETLSFQDLSKKINWKLQANFFTLEEAKNLKPRKLRKVIKLIAKIEGIKLNRKEIKDLAIFIQTDFKDINQKSISKLWDFVILYEKSKTDEEKADYILEDQVEFSSYLDGRFELMRN